MSAHATADKCMAGFSQKDLHIYKYTLGFWKSNAELIWTCQTTGDRKYLVNYILFDLNW